MKPDRMLRVNELVKRELGLLLERKIVPDLHCLVTVTAVRTSPDLREARVAVSVYGAEEQQHRALALLQRYRRELQAELNRSVHLKYTPVLHFELDRAFEEADRVLNILSDLDLPEEDADEQGAGDEEPGATDGGSREP